MENSRLINENPLVTKPIGSLLQKYAIPGIVAMLVGALYNIVDQFFIGQKIGELGNAATNVAFPLTTSCVAIALLLGIGGAAAFNLSMGGCGHLIRADGSPKYAMLCNLSGAIINAILDPIFIACSQYPLTFSQLSASRGKVYLSR